MISSNGGIFANSGARGYFIVGRDSYVKPFRVMKGLISTCCNVDSPGKLYEEFRHNRKETLKMIIKPDGFDMITLIQHYHWWH